MAVAVLCYDALLYLLLTIYGPSRFDWISSVDLRTTLCLVCRGWASTIYSAPEFWVSVPVTLGTTRRFLGFQLGKSSTRPLSVFLHLIPFRINRRPLGFTTEIQLVDHSEFMRVVVPKLLGQFQRIQHLTIACETLGVWRQLMSCFSTVSAPALHRVAVTFPTSHLHGWHIPPAQLAPPPAFLGAAQLAELRISGTACIWTGPSTYAFLTTLRLLRLRGAVALHWPTMVGILRAAPLLQVLQLSQVQCTNTDHSPVIVMASLTDLYITYTDLDTLPPICRLAMPKLQTLHLHILSDTVQPFIDRFGAVFARVQHAELYLSHFTVTDVAGVLQSMPTIQSVDFSHSRPRLFEYFMDLLASQRIRLPALHETRIGFAPSDTEVQSYLFFSDCAEHTGRTLSRLLHSEGIVLNWSVTGGCVRYFATEMQSPARIEDEWSTLEHRRGFRGH